MLIDGITSIADNHPGALIDNALGDVKHGHDDVPGVGHEDDSGGGLKHPICIMLVVYGRMIEIYLVTSLGPIPLATIGNSEWRWERLPFPKGFGAY